MAMESVAVEPFEYVAGDRSSGLLIICDHARPDIPARYNNLGLDGEALQRHIAFDIGVRDLTLSLAEQLGVPAVLSTFSRLLIDPNRGEDDPTLVMRISDGDLIPGNAYIGEEEITERLRDFYMPYHDRVSEELVAIDEESGPAIIFSIHSFTPVWRGMRRPWEAAVLWDNDPRMAIPLIEHLREEPGFTVGDNEPYDGALLNDCLFRHGTRTGRANALLEVRQDLIDSDVGVKDWSDRMARILALVLKADGLREKRFFGSRALPAGGRLVAHAALDT